MELKQGKKLIMLMKKTVLLIFTAILTILFSLIYKDRLNLEYNEEGRFFDENTATVYHQQAVSVYGLIALFFFILTLIFIKRIFKNCKTK